LQRPIVTELDVVTVEAVVVVDFDVVVNVETDDFVTEEAVVTEVVDVPVLVVVVTVSVVLESVVVLDVQTPQSTGHAAAMSAPASTFVQSCAESRPQSLGSGNPLHTKMDEVELDVAVLVVVFVVVVVCVVLLVNSLHRPGQTSGTLKGKNSSGLLQYGSIAILHVGGSGSPKQPSGVVVVIEVTVAVDLVTEVVVTVDLVTEVPVVSVTVVSVTVVSVTVVSVTVVSVTVVSVTVVSVAVVAVPVVLVTDVSVAVDVVDVHVPHSTGHECRTKGPWPALSKQAAGKNASQSSGSRWP
jgi:protein kinase X